MEEVWSDMKLTELPSWMSPAPPNWGTAARGKLTADQWMVVCTVHLPVTLIRLWGNLTDRRFELLCNFIDLTSAVQLATQRSITAQMINDHELLIARYLNGMKRLFKGSKVQPIHHVALHTGDFLRLFGPTHAVQAFGGERLLEVLGLQNANNKSGTPWFDCCYTLLSTTVTGEMEATFTTSICRSSNLQTILARDDITSAARPLIDAFTKIATEDHRGTRLADEIHHPPTKPPKNLTLSHTVHQLLVSLLNQRSQTLRYTTTWDSTWYVPRTVTELDKVSIRGVVYASVRSLPRDSNIIFRKPGDPKLRVGRIHTIFSSPYVGTNHLETKVTCLVVEEWLPVADVNSQQTYQQFGFAGGFLCQNRVAEVASVVEVDNVVCHFARTFLGQRDGDIFHVLPLNKVGKLRYPVIDSDLIPPDARFLHNAIGQRFPLVTSGSTDYLP